MKIRIHWVAGLFWFLCLLFDLTVWGAVKDLADVGPKIRATAQNQAPLALTYMVVGEQLDRLVPGLGSFGKDYAEQAFADVLPRIKDDPNIAIVALLDRTTNRQHFTVRMAYWGMPVLLALFVLLWWRRPRQVRMMGSRR